MKALWLEHGGQYRHHDENMMFSIGMMTRTWCPAQASWLEHPRLCARQFAALQGAQVCRLLYWTCWFRYVILMERAGFLQFLWRCWNPGITGVSSCKKKILEPDQKYKSKCVGWSCPNHFADVSFMIRLFDEGKNPFVWIDKSLLMCAVEYLHCSWRLL